MTRGRAFCRSLLQVGLWLAAATLLHAQSPGPDLRISKTDSNSGFAFQGQTNFIFTITVTSTSNSATAGQVTVTDSVPPGMTATSISGTGWSCGQPAGPCSTTSSLKAGQFYPPLTLTVNVDPKAPAVVTNTATVSCNCSIEGLASTVANDRTVIISNVVTPVITSLGASPTS